MTGISEIITLYVSLEHRIQKLMNAACSPFCSACHAPCCKVDFCQESIENPFLIEVRKKCQPAVVWDENSGWLTPRGCCLEAGRPPVCYEFLCLSILQCQPSVERQDALKKLAMLLTNAGRRVAGQRHLVEVDDLECLNLVRLKRQLLEAEGFLGNLAMILEC